MFNSLFSFDNFLVIVNSDTNLVFKSFTVWIISDNALEMMECTERIKSLNLPLLQIRDSKVTLKEGYKWNYSPLIENYYPKNYLNEEIMWDMTKANYASDVYYKGYPWHYDNNLPGLERLFEKADNLMAFPLFKGFGFYLGCLEHF